MLENIFNSSTLFVYIKSEANKQAYIPDEREAGTFNNCRFDRTVVSTQLHRDFGSASNHLILYEIIWSSNFWP